MGEKIGVTFLDAGPADDWLAGTPFETDAGEESAAEAGTADEEIRNTEEPGTLETASESGEGDPKGEGNGGGFAWIWFLGAGILLFLAALLLYRTFFRKRRGEQEHEEGPEDEGSACSGYMRTPAPPPVPAAVSHVGNLHHIGSREEQQDSFAISDVTDSMLCDKRGAFAVVADGMGGLSNGAKISAIVTSSMMSRFEKGSTEGLRGEREIPMELLQMVQDAEREVLRFLGTGQEQSGSTVVAAWIYAGRLYFISVGDSRICLLRNGTVTVLNREHTYGSELDEMAARGEISIKEAREDAQRHALTSYVGIEPLERIDRNVHGLPLLPGDKILLMSDGVFGTVSEEEILKAAVRDAGDMAQDLQAMVLSHMRSGQDNFTAVILQCE